MLFFSGCISLDINQEIKENGTSNIELIYDLSQIEEQMKSFQNDLNNSSISNSNNTEENEIDFCNDIREDNPENFNFNCEEVEENIIKLTGDFDTNSYFQKNESLFKTTYTFDAIFIFSILGQIGGEEGKITPESLSEMRILNPDLSYTIKMPGEISKSEVGRISKSTVKLDLFELDKKESVLIIAEKKNNTIFIIGSILILLIIIVISYFIILNKRKKMPNENLNNLSQEEIRCKDYIFQYKNSFSREAIKQVLLNENISESTVNEYLNKYY